MKKIFFILSQYLMPHRLAGYCIEKIALSQNKFLKNRLIKIFIRFFKVNLTESDKTAIEDYKNFNAFFTRSLRKSVRAQTQSPQVCVSPVDGVIGDFGAIQQDTLFMAKGVSYQISDLLGGSNNFSQKFLNGHFVSFYLSPRHYHRIHVPYAAKLRQMTYIPGRFFSVSQLAMSLINNIYTKNERVVCHFETDHGSLCMILIGAMFVGSIHTKWHGRVQTPGNIKKTWMYDQDKINLDYLEVLGHFQMGSSVIMLWSGDQLNMSETIVRNQEIKFGENLGVFSTDDLYI